MQKNKLFEELHKLETVAKLDYSIFDLFKKVSRRDIDGVHVELSTLEAIYTSQTIETKQETQQVSEFIRLLKGLVS